MKKVNFPTINVFVVLMGLVLSVCLMGKVQASTYDRLVYQGMLYDEQGDVVDATLSVTFRIYEDEEGGTALWEETQNVMFDQGVFTAELGVETPISEDLFLNESLYLSVQIEDDDESEPRLGLYSVPTAFYAQKATVADSLADGLLITTNQIADDGITSAKISSGAVGATQLADTGVTAGTYGSDSFVPQLTVDSKGRVTSVSNVSISMSAGDITSVTAGTGLTGGSASGDATLNVDVGTTANKIVQLDGSAKLPALDGSALTNLTLGTDSVTSATIVDGEIVSADLSDTAALSDAQINNDLTIDGGLIDATVIGGVIPADGSFLTGTFAAVVIDAATQDGLMFNPYGVNAGETSELQFLELATNGANVVGFKSPDSLVADVIWTLPNADGSAGEILSTDGLGNLSWVPAASGDITSVTAGTGLTGGSASGDATLNVDVGTTANKIVQLNGLAQLPAVDGSLLTGIAPANDSVTSAKIIDGEIVSADISGTADISDAQISDTLTASVFKGSGTASDAVDLGTAEVAGTLDLSKGGTGADLSATGGANQFVKQTSAGGVLTVGSITDADVPNSLTVDLSSTATSLAANGGNCLAGSYPLGVDASGNVESCTVAATGTVTSVTAGTGLTGGPITTTGSLAVDVGTTADKIVQLNGSAELPAVSGANLTNLNATNLSSGSVSDARLSANVSLLGSSISSSEIVDDDITETDLSSILTFADGDMINLSSINASSASEGLKLPQSTNVSSATAEGQISWDTDSDTLYVGDGSTQKGMPRILDRMTTPVAVTNTTTETSVYSYSVPANLLGTTGAVRVTLFGTYLCTATSRTLTVKINYGATTIYADTSLALGTLATERVVKITFTLMNRAVTNSQVLVGDVMISRAATATSGFGDLSATGTLNVPIYGVAAEDSTAAKTLNVLVKHSSAAATGTFTAQAVTTEFLP